MNNNILKKICDKMKSKKKKCTEIKQNIQLIKNSTDGFKIRLNKLVLVNLKLDQKYSD